MRFYSILLTNTIHGNMQQRLTTVWQEFAKMNVHYSYCFSRADQQVCFGENETAGLDHMAGFWWIFKEVPQRAGIKGGWEVSSRKSKLRRPYSLAHTHTESDNDNSAFPLATIDFFLISIPRHPLWPFYSTLYLRTCFSWKKYCRLKAVCHSGFPEN